MPINPGLGFVLGETAANQLHLPPNRAIFYGALGAILPTPVGLGVTLALANREAAAQPQPQPPPLPVPGQVANLRATPASANSIVLSWDPLSTVGAGVTYTVQFGGHGSNIFATAADNLIGTSFTVSGLIPNSTYDFRVIAANATGSGPPSDLATATTPQAGYIAIP
jgi:hypothetical protein